MLNEKKSMWIVFIISQSKSNAFHLQERKRKRTREDYYQTKFVTELVLRFEEKFHLERYLIILGFFCRWIISSRIIQRENLNITFRINFSCYRRCSSLRCFFDRFEIRRQNMIGFFCATTSCCLWVRCCLRTKRCFSYLFLISY